MLFFSCFCPTLTKQHLCGRLPGVNGGGRLTKTYLCLQLTTHPPDPVSYLFSPYKSFYVSYVVFCVGTVSVSGPLWIYFRFFTSRISINLSIRLELNYRNAKIRQVFFNRSRFKKHNLCLCYLLLRVFL